MKNDQTIQVMVDQDQTFEIKVAMDDIFNSIEVKGVLRQKLCIRPYNMSKPLILK
ncbi:MAG: hypothetical protein IPF52_10850 [Saprospiraceae bacterium]|nr:hypothetical protein [Saprospiraceae bacterium]